MTVPVTVAWRIGAQYGYAGGGVQAFPKISFLRVANEGYRSSIRSRPNCLVAVSAATGDA